MEHNADTEIPPIANPDLVGHGIAETLLKRSFKSNNMAHAWIFAGPKGIGKATLAHRFARYVLANGEVGLKEMEPTGPNLFDTDPNDAAVGNGEGDDLFMPSEHPIFQRAVAGSHADLMVIERRVDEKTGRRKSQILVDEVRRVKGFLSHTAGEGAWRVVIIDSADEMNRNAANALLKVLEEPPARALMILVCHNPGRMLPTIRSRCRTLNLRPPAMADVIAYVRGRLPDLSETEAERIAVVSEGSIGKAFALCEAGGMEVVDEITRLMVKTTVRLPVSDIHDFAGRLGRAGNEQAFDTFSTILRWWLERLVVTKSGGPSISSVDADMFTQVLNAADLDRWMEVWEKVTRLLDSVSVANLDRKQVVLNTFIAVDAAVHRRA